MTTIKPFKIDVPQGKLDDLHQRLRNTSWPTTIEGQDYGGPSLSRMKHLAAKAIAFDWRKKEAQLIALPQSTTEIDGLQSSP